MKQRDRNSDLSLSLSDLCLTKKVCLARVMACCFPLVTPRALVRGMVIEGEPGIFRFPWMG